MQPAAEVEVGALCFALPEPEPEPEPIPVTEYEPETCVHILLPPLLLHPDQPGTAGVPACIRIASQECRRGRLRYKSKRDLSMAFLQTRLPGP